ncbi:MAG: type II toxin-antitoxin system MqsA family antitoxin [Clostridia bacterium]|jgi:hypothetical protein
MECFMCKGELIEKKVNYMVDLEKTIIIIKDVPAKVCDQCGEQYFDDETSQNIEKIVNKLKDLSTEVTIINYKENVA